MAISACIMPSADSCTMPLFRRRSRLSACPSSEVCGQPAGAHVPPQVFPPEALTAVYAAAVEEILAEPLPRRRLRAASRVVKRKMSNFKLKRPSHRDWPQPTRPVAEAVSIL